MNYKSTEVTSEDLTREASAFNLKKRLGQHFLVDADVLHTIVGALDAKPGDKVIEVGSGIGFLTRLLVRTAADVVAVDLDRESTRMLADMSLPRVQIKQGDFLQFDINRLDFFPRKGEESEKELAPLREGRLKIIGNVPYQITGRIIGHILGELDKPSPWLNSIDNVVLTIQYEVAKRMVAKAGEEDYSRVSLLIEYYCKASIVSVVPPEAFYPPPQVTSAVIKLEPLPKPSVECRNTVLLRQVIEAGFRQRRKMLKNSLSFLRFTPEEIDQVLRKLQFDPQVRAERISLKQFAMLADALDELPKTNANSTGDFASETESNI